MTAIALQLLPLGFRFDPTDEELVNHYLKRKITGRSKSEVEVIPEVDVCKCEPWDLPDKSIIRSDDPKWFFFAPKDRKYANGHRANRATEAGYWKATGKDRVIRSKAALAGHNVIGMKKTLVFHRGRAPKGIRTRWIMHEYRTTEPEFESGVQGGYVLYLLFKKQEENSSNTKADETEGSFSSTQAKLSPDDTQHEEDVLEEIATPLDQESSESVLQEEPHFLPASVEQQPAGIQIWLADKTDAATTYSVKPDDSPCNVVSDNCDAKAGVHADPLQDVSAQYRDPRFEHIVSNGFPNIGSPILPYTDYFFGNMNHDTGYVNNSVEDPLNEFLNAVLSNQDEYSSGACNVLKDSVAESLPRHSIWDSASCRDSRASSDIDTEATLPQELLGLEASKPFEGSTFPLNDPLQMNSLYEYAEMEPQLSALYENATLLPYDSTGPDVYSVDSTAESLQDLFNSMEESNNQKNVANNGNDLEGPGITIRARQPQHPSDSNNIFAQQGTAARRFRLQGSSQMALCFSADSESSSSKDDHEYKEVMKKALQDLFDSTEKSLTQNNTPSNEDGLQGTGIKISARQALYRPSLKKLSSKQGTAARRIGLQAHLEVGTFAGRGGESSSSKDNHELKESLPEAGEHVDDNIAKFGETSKPALPDKLELPVRDKTSQNSEFHLESKPMLRLRTRWIDDNANIPEAPLSRGRIPRTASVVYVVWLVLSVILVLMCVGIWRCINSQCM